MPTFTFGKICQRTFHNNNWKKLFYVKFNMYNENGEQKIKLTDKDPLGHGQQ